MNTCSAGSWIDFHEAATALEWHSAMSMLASAPKLDASALVHLDRIRGSVFNAIADGPPEVLDILRSRIVLSRAASVCDSDWGDALALEVFASALGAFANAVEQECWSRVPMTFGRLLSIPRQSDRQDQLLTEAVCGLIQLARAIENRMPSAIVEEPDHGRFGWRTDALEAKYLDDDGYILEIVAAVLRSLCREEKYEKVAAEVMLEALMTLEWPTLRHLRWFARAPTPCRADPRWLRALSRRVVRTFTARF